MPTVLQAGHLLGLHTFPKGLVAILRDHQSTELVLEAAWLLAHVLAGPEAHMRVIVKHGGAEAVANALSSAVDKQVASPTQHHSSRRDLKTHYIPWQCLTAHRHPSSPEHV